MNQGRTLDGHMSFLIGIWGRVRVGHNMFQVIGKLGDPVIWPFLQSGAVNIQIFHARLLHKKV
jgi:hypothetical protein